MLIRAILKVFVLRRRKLLLKVLRLRSRKFADRLIVLVDGRLWLFCRWDCGLIPLLCWWWANVLRVWLGVG